jgi:hypothetical protein
MIFHKGILCLHHLQPWITSPAGGSFMSSMRRILFENGLSIFLVTSFVVLMAAQAFSGHLQYNEKQQEHGEAEVNFLEYLGTPHFLEATMENWESEFLQMFVFVLFTTFLYQKGSAESKKLDEAEPVDKDPSRKRLKKNAPAAVRAGGWILKLYENSLSLCFLLLFLVSFMLHAVGGVGEYNEEQLQHGGQTLSVLQYLGTSRFWFESFQNWQSEFLAIASMVIFSIFLRQKGSPESKPVDSPHSETGKG